MFRELAKAPELSLKVFYACDWGVRQYFDPEFGTDLQWDIPLLDGYDHEFLPTAHRPRRMSFFEVDNPSIGAALSAFDPHAVWVFGYAYRSYLRALRWSKRAGAYTMFFGDSQLLTPRSWRVRAVKRLFVPYVYAQCDAFITIGDNNEAYYRHYGVSPAKMYRGAYPVEIGRFRKAIDGMDDAAKARLKSELGLAGDRITLLFCGKFIPRKRPLDLIQSISILQRQGILVQALFIGAGELETQMRDLARELGVESQIRIAGFVNQQTMPGVLALGDALVMSSDDDPHPLAVTEAMAVGNAIIASDRIGCVGPTDSARPGVNALVYRMGDASDLSERIRMIAVDPALKERLRAQSWELAMTQDVSVTVVAARKALAARSLSRSATR